MYCCRVSVGSGAFAICTEYGDCCKQIGKIFEKVKSETSKDKRPTAKLLWHVYVLVPKMISTKVHVIQSFMAKRRYICLWMCAWHRVYYLYD